MNISSWITGGEPTVLAHSGHWLVNLVYAVPVAVVFGLLGVQRLRDRRRSGTVRSKPASVTEPKR